MQTTKVSIIIVTYNSIGYLSACLESIYKHTTYAFEIIVVDNCSTDGTPNFIKQMFPIVKVINSTYNRGYGGGNNLGVKYAIGNYIVVLNPDTIVEEGWLHELIRPLVKEDRIVTIPKVLSYDGTKINTCGNQFHFTGLAFIIGFNRQPNTYNDRIKVSAISGCCFAITRENYLQLGGFDENIFMYYDDIDFSINARTNGFEIILIPTAIIRHDYALRLQYKKIYMLEKGRYFIIKKYYSPSFFLVLLPSFILVEILTAGFVLQFGIEGLRQKYQAFYDTLKIHIEKRNKVSDIKIFASSLPIDGQVKLSRLIILLIRMLNVVFMVNSYLLDKICAVINISKA